MFPAVLLVVTLAGPIPTADDQCERIEINHVYNLQGEHVLDQVIYWQYYGDSLHVKDWRWLKDKNQFPRKTGQYWQSLFLDQNTLRRIRAPTFLESYSLYDPELADRALLPCENRTLLAP
jgi:hypothetical protein